jgi:hypothetical protein
MQERARAKKEVVAGMMLLHGKATGREQPRKNMHRNITLTGHAQAKQKGVDGVLPLHGGAARQVTRQRRLELKQRHGVRHAIHHHLRAQRLYNK